MSNTAVNGPREWLIVSDRPYDAPQDPALEGDLLNLEGDPLAIRPILALMYASRAEPDRFPHAGDAVALHHVYGGFGPAEVYGPSTLFAFSTATA